MILPTDARTEREAFVFPVVKLLEQKIDKYLSTRGSNYSGEWWVDVTDYSSDVREALIKLYEKAWNVRFVSDQRDGDSLVFKERGQAK